jgi:tetratricopeptide (TPR) repeat protein
MRPIKSVVLASACISQLFIIAPTPAIGYQASSVSPELGKSRSIAESQHEIVMLLMRKKEYAQALTEAKKIFFMKWPAEQEPQLLKELLYITDQFLHENQPAMGVTLLESSAAAFKSNESHARICKEKGYLYKTLNQNDRAIECFREAQRFEASSSK